MPASGAEQEQRRAENGGKPHLKPATEGEQPDRRKAQAGEADFALKRAIRPADKVRHHLAEKDVHDEVVEVAERNRKQDETGQQRLGDNRGGQRTRLE